MMGKALHAVEVVTFDYPCEFIFITTRRENEMGSFFVFVFFLEINN